MTKPRAEDLSRRERQIMDVIYRVGKATAAEVREAIPRPPSNTAVRTLLKILQEKGHLKVESDGTRYIYEPIIPRDEMAKSVIRNVVDTFFGGSVERVVSTLLTSGESRVSDDELAKLEQLIQEAKADPK